MSDVGYAGDDHSGPRDAPSAAPAMPAYGPGPGPGGASAAEREASARGDALTALITSSVLIISCVGFLTVPAAILSGVALSKADRDPDGSRKLLRMAWIAMAAGLWVTIWLVIVFYFLRKNQFENEPYLLYH